MKKKVFSLMTTLLLAIMVVAEVRLNAAVPRTDAQELTVNDGTETSYYVPFWGYYAHWYQRNEMVYPAADLAVMNGTEISAVQFYCDRSDLTYGGTFQLLLEEVDATTSTTFLGTNNAVLVYEGTMDVVGDLLTVNFTTPYTYNGGNLLMIVNHTVVGESPRCYWIGAAAPNNSSRWGYSSTSFTAIGTPYSSFDGAFLPKTTFTYTEIVTPEPSDDPEIGLHVVYDNGEARELVIDELYLGEYPAGAWMAPFQFKMYNDDSQALTVSVLDFTPNTDALSMAEGTVLPFTVAANAADSVDLAIQVQAPADAEAGDYEYQFVAIYEGSRLAKIWPLSFTIYTPEIPDVVEKAYDLGTIGDGYTYTGVPSEITPTVLHNDYTLPFPEIPEGNDAVYKFTVEGDMIISAYVDETNADGKVALYTEDFYGESGPMAHNNYTSLPIRGRAEYVDEPTAETCGSHSNLPLRSSRAPWDLMHSFSCSSGYQYGVATDGNFIYTSSWSASSSSQFYKYDLSGNLVDEFNVAGSGQIRDLTYDGQYFYGVANSSTVYCLDLANQTLISSFTSAYGAQRGITYDPVRDGFWVIGNWSGDLTLINRSGAVQFTGPAPTSASGLAYYKDEANVEHVYCFNNGNNQVYDYNIAANAIDPVSLFDFSATPGYDSGSSGGCHVGEYDGKVCFFGDLQQSPNLVGIYELRDAPAPIPFTGHVAGPVIEDVAIQAGTYYLVTSSTDADYTVYINVNDMPCPAIDAAGFALNPYPADDQDSIQPASVTLSWTTPEYATGWRLVFGSTYYPEAGHPQTVIYPADGSFSTEMANSYTVTNLWNNTNYFWHVEFNNDGACPDGVSSPIWGFTTHLNVPQHLVASPNEIIEGETTTLTWNSIADRTYRRYRVYQDGVMIYETPDTPNPNVANNLTYTVEGLAYNMTGYTFNVTAVYDEGESAFSNDAIVKVTGYSATNGINGYVYEQDGTTPIGGVTVTVTGTDEFGHPQTYNFETNTEGYYEGQVLVGTYTTAIATCPGYQDAEPYQNGPDFSVAYQGHHDDMNFIMDEVFCPPFQVWAEYIDVDGTELVKVWWEPCHSDFRGEDGTRALNHYRVYRTDCYNDGPFTEENTILLSTVWVPDTAYIDVSWPDAAPGVYKWGVGAVYAGNNPNNPNNLREGEINWIMPTAPRYDDATADNCEWSDEFVASLGGTRAPWDLLNSFDASSGGQYGIATDGNFIYTSSWAGTAANQFHKYDMDGNHIESFNLDGFTVPSSGCFRDITYDGQYFYGVTNNSDLHCFDLANHTYIGSVNTGLSSLRHCSYDPVNDGFWVGGWYDLQLVSRTGAVMQTGPVLDGASGTGYFTAEDGSAHLYLFYQPASNTAYIYDYDIASGIVGDEMLFDFTTTPGYVAGTSGGCYIGEYNGTMAFFGLVQNTPGLIGIYDLIEIPTPGVGTFNELALPRESLTVWSNCLDKDMYIPSFDGDEPVSVNVLLNSADSPEGTTVSFTNLNEYEQIQYGIDPLTLDGSGHYVFDSFRRGRYAIEVYHEGFYTIFDTVNIGFEPDDIRELRYVMIEILYPVRDLYVSNTGVALWSLTEGWEGSNPGVTPDPTPGDPVVLFEDDFEGEIQWTFVDSDGDGEQWEIIYSPTITAHSGAKVAASFSWNWSAYDPDQWMISPLVEGATSIHYYMSTNTVFHDHYGIFASSTGTNLADFTLVFDETPFTDKGVAAVGNRDDRPQSEWQERTVELPAGTKYVAFRHYDSPNMSNVLIEDVTIYGNSRAEAQTRHFQYYKVMCTSVDGEPIFNASVTEPYCQLNTDDLVEGETYICKVAAMFSTGLSPWVEKEWVYQLCDNFTGTVNGVTVNNGVLTWTYPAVENATAPDFEAAALVSDLTTDTIINGYSPFGIRAMWDQIYTYETTTGYQYGIATDGTNIYHSAWSSNATNQFYKYDMQGNFIEGFEIAGCGYLRGMAYDGQYFYGVDNTNTIYCIDLANQTLVSTFTTTYGAMRCITYDPVRDGFWVVGNWSGALSLIDRTGTVHFASVVNRTDVSDVAYYNDENNVEHVLLFCQPGGNGNAVVFDYEIANNIVSASPVFDVFPTIPGATGGSGGCFVADYNGYVAFYACIQGSPNLVGIYELSISTAPVPFPIASGEIIGAAIMLDGQIVSFVNYPTNTWTMPDTRNEYAVCIIYNGPMDGTYFSMSCPEFVNDQFILNVEENKAEVSLFPNPTNGNVKIMAKAMQHITVVSTLGQVVYDADVNADELDLNMARFNAGVYVVRIVTETGTTTQRVTVVR